MEQVRFKRKTVDLGEMEKQKNKKQAKRNAFYVFLFLFILILFCGTAFFLFFRVSEITVTGGDTYSEEQIILASEIEIGDNMFSFSEKAISERVRDALPYVGELKVKRKIPNKITLEVAEEQAVMYLSINGEHYLLSDELTVLGVEQNKGQVPSRAIKLVTGSVDRCLVGQPLTFMDARTRETVLEMYEVLSVNEMQYSIREINVSARFDITMQYTDRFKVYVGDINDFDLKIPFLSAVIGELYEEDKGKIDISSYKEATVSLE